MHAGLSHSEPQPPHIWGALGTVLQVASEPGAGRVESLPVRSSLGTS